jgi:hypothetical protein
MPEADWEAANDTTTEGSTPTRKAGSSSGRTIETESNRESSRGDQHTWQRQGSLLFADCPDEEARPERIRLSVDGASTIETDSHPDADSEAPQRGNQQWQRQGALFFTDFPDEESSAPSERIRLSFAG